MLLRLAVLAACVAAAIGMSSDFNDTATANFKVWNGALKTKNADGVAALYNSDKLSFLPTVSPEHIKGFPATKTYFVEFTKKNPAGIITDESVQELTPLAHPGGAAYLHSGLYTFMTGDDDARVPVSARFTYVWQRVLMNNNLEYQWKIMHHHSSALPVVSKRRAWTTDEAETGWAESAAAEVFAAFIAAYRAEAAVPAATRRQSQADLDSARANFKIWNDKLQTKDPKQIAALYSDPKTGGELSFLPTVVPEHIKSILNTEEYFVEFTKKHPFGTITDDSVQMFNNGNTYLHSGLYTFAMGEVGARTATKARFSYIWRKYGAEWKITHHHSSVLPKSETEPIDKVDPSGGMLATAQANFKAWNEALATKDHKLVAKMYSARALSFLPTVSPEHIRSLTGTEAYFSDFVKKNPDGRVTDESVQMYDEGKAYLHTGMYTFMLGDQHGDNRAPLSARFSYTWKDYGVDNKTKDWKITHHHSSVTPGQSAEAPSGKNQKYIIDLAAATVAMALLAAIAAFVAAVMACMPPKKPAAVVAPKAPPPVEFVVESEDEKAESEDETDLGSA